MREVQEITTYPFQLQPFGDGYKYAILETDYFLYYGKRQLPDGTFELFAKIVNRYYPHDLISDGEKSNLSIYKVGSNPSAEWTLTSKQNKKVYLFLSNTTSYISNQSRLPENLESSFDSSDADLSSGAIENLRNIYDIVSESGSYFDKNRNYRYKALVKSQLTGDLYFKFTEGESIPGDNQLDPSKDSKNWKLLVTDNGEISNNFVDLNSDQLIRGSKTFETIMKEEFSQSPLAKEIICFKEAENNFLKKNDTATASRSIIFGQQKLAASDIGGIEGNQVLVATGSDGKISDSFLHAPIVGNPLTLTVDPSRSDNIRFFDTIQDAFDKAKQMIRTAPITISVVDGEYSNQTTNDPVLNLIGVYDCSNIQIIGNINNPELCRIKINSAQQGIFFAGKGLYINGFKILQENSDKGDSIGIKLDYGASMRTGASIIIDGCNYGVKAQNLSTLTAQGIVARNCNIAYSADNSSLDLTNSKTISCIHSYVSKNNSFIQAEGSILQKGSILAETTIGFQAEFNSVIRANNTQNNSTTIDKPYNDMVNSTPNTTNGIIQYT